MKEPLVLSSTFDPSPTLLQAIQSLAVLDGAVERSTAPVISYHASKKPLAAIRGFHERKTVAVRNVSAANLLDALTRSAMAHVIPGIEQGIEQGSRTCHVRDWHYYSAANDSATMALVRSIPQSASVLHLLASLAATGAESGREAVHSANIWLGGGGVTSFNHYDASFNAFAQWTGRKTFYLTGPRAAESHLEVHSYLHPQFRRTQHSPFGSAFT